MSESERVRSTVHHCTNINPDNSDNSDNPGRTDNFIVKFCLTLSQTLQFLCRVRAFFRRYENRSKVPKLPISCVPRRIYSKNSLLNSTLQSSVQSCGTSEHMRWINANQCKNADAMTAT